MSPSGSDVAWTFPRGKFLIVPTLPHGNDRPGVMLRAATKRGSLYLHGG